MYKFTDRQTHRQTDRQTDRGTDTNRNRTDMVTAITRSGMQIDSQETSDGQRNVETDKPRKNQK